MLLEGSRVRRWMDGQLIVDYELGRDEGLIGLQEYGSEVFRNIKIREMSEHNPQDTDRRSTVTFHPPLRPRGRPSPSPIVGESPAMLEIRRRVDLWARDPTCKLITGETGTGKELVARAFYEKSGRGGRFVPVNCAAIPETVIEAELFGVVKGAYTGAEHSRKGYFEAAEGGILFLDEIGELPPPVQATLLRAIDFGEISRVGSPEVVRVDVWIVAATNVELEKAVHARSFRGDLFWRLNQRRLQLLPLRNRPGDVPLLAEHFRRDLASATGEAVGELSTELLSALEAHDWPGNVRELRDAISHAVSLAAGGALRVEHLPYHIQEAWAGSGAEDAPEVLFPEKLVRDAEISRLYRLHVWQRASGNLSHAAEILGVHRQTVRRWLREYRVLPPTES